MANRFTDTSIWLKAWFQALPPLMKSVWRYLIDNCDHAGIWEINPAAFRYFIDQNTDLTVDQVLEVPAFKTRIFKIQDDKLFIPGFIDYQYKGNLNPANKVHKSVIDRLNKCGIDFKQYSKIKPLAEPLMQGAIEIEQEIELEKEQDPGSKLNFQNDIENICREFYPSNIGFALGVADLLPQINNTKDLSDLKAAVTAYGDRVKSAKTDPKYIKHLTGFAKCWREWVPKGPQKPALNLVQTGYVAEMAAVEANISPDGLERAKNDPIAKEFLKKLNITEETK